MGQLATEVEIALPVSLDTLTISESIYNEGKHYKSEIAQRTLSDLGREDHAKA